ncbi:unnamed protein product [Clavelina lepadiformis]|uniref:NPC intracellular cholesterol transporter 2 n=1 Tax=Clavelina lepadiformis TaxID=159417 RepID=A0ABP0GN77_CLALP
MKYLLLAIGFLAIYNVVRCEITVKDCGSKVGKINKVNVSNCAKSPCNLQQGKKYTVNVTFTINEASDKAFAKVYGIVDSVAVPFPLNQPNACIASGLKCPLKMGNTYTYTSTLSVLKEYPAIKVVVQWELFDAKENGNMIFCFETPIQVVG